MQIFKTQWNHFTLKFKADLQDPVELEPFYTEKIYSHPLRHRATQQNMSVFSLHIFDCMRIKQAINVSKQRSENLLSRLRSRLLKKSLNAIVNARPVDAGLYISQILLFICD